jgi:hypothetical protein
MEGRARAHLYTDGVHTDGQKHHDGVVKMCLMNSVIITSVFARLPVTFLIGRSPSRAGLGAARGSRPRLFQSDLDAAVGKTGPINDACRIDRFTELLGWVGYRVEGCECDQIIYPIWFSAGKFVSMWKKSQENAMQAHAKILRSCQGFLIVVHPHCR